MYGAIIGDLAGSIYEFEEFSDRKNKIQNIKRRLEILNKKNLIDKDSFFSDDSILTIAVMDAINNGVSYEEKFREYYELFKNYSPNFKTFPSPFSSSFVNWIKNGYDKSKGNGGAMRISPIAYLCDNESKLINEVERNVKITHNTNEAIEGSIAVALIIYYGKKGYSKDKIKRIISSYFDYDLDLNFDLIRETNTFTSNCKKTVEISLAAIFKADNFEDCVKLGISAGGDTDTIGAITGSMAESLYKIDKKLIEKTTTNIPNIFVKVLKKGYNKIN